jgi:hypothetical protein
MLTPHMTLKVTLLAVGGVIALAGWFLLGFDAIYLASFRLSQSGAVLPAIVLLVEVGVVASLFYRYQGQRFSHIESALPAIWLCDLINVVFVVFFWGGL